MDAIRETAQRFFDACESGTGWEGCREFCTPDATFSCQADALAEIQTLEDYTNWMAGLYQLLPNGGYEVRSVAVDDERGNACAFGVFRGTHTGEGGPVPPTGRSTETHYVYLMEFQGGRIRHLTKVWNELYTSKELGWVQPSP